MNTAEIEEYLETLLAGYPIFEYSFGDVAQIPFSNKIFTICETDCKRYGHSWACPPNAGTIENNMNRIGHYHRFLVYSAVWEVADAFIQEACLLARKGHEVVAREIRERVLEHFGLAKTGLDEEPAPPIHFLSAGCCVCDECGCPEIPCSHPKDRLMSMESHGILILKLAEDLEMTSAIDSQSVVYFSMILY